MLSACGGQTIGTSRFTEKYLFTAISDKGRQPFCRSILEELLEYAYWRSSMLLKMGERFCSEKDFIMYCCEVFGSQLKLGNVLNEILNCKNVQFSNTSFDWFTVMKCYEEWSGQIKGFWLGATSRDHCNHIGRWKSIFAVETDIWKTFWNVWNSHSCSLFSPTFQSEIVSE